MSTKGWINRLVTNVDLDSCAEVDCISYEFAKRLQLQQAKLSAPLLEAAGRLRMNNYGVYRVPLTLTDSRGATRQITRPCVAIDRDPRPEGHPILLSMTTLVEERIHLSPWQRQWWFEHSAASYEFKLATPYQFEKAARNQAHVFAIISAAES